MIIYYLMFLFIITWDINYAILKYLILVLWTLSPL